MSKLLVKLTDTKVNATPAYVTYALGAIDCLTTVIGVSIYKIVEFNPLMSLLITYNISLFVILKLATAGIISLCLLLAQKQLFLIKNKTTKESKACYLLLNLGLFTILTIYVITITNNILILFSC